MSELHEKAKARGGAVVQLRITDYSEGVTIKASGVVPSKVAVRIHGMILDGENTFECLDLASEEE